MNFVSQLERCVQEMAQKEARIKDAIQNKADLDAQIQAVQTDLEGLKEEAQASHQSASHQKAQRQNLEREIAEMRETNMKLRQEVTEVAGMISNLDASRIQRKLHFIEQCQALKLATRALITKCDEANQA